MFDSYQENLKKMASQKKELEKMTIEIGAYLHNHALDLSQKLLDFANNTQLQFQESMQQCNSFIFPGMVANQFFSQKPFLDKKKP